MGPVPGIDIVQKQRDEHLCQGCLATMPLDYLLNKKKGVYGGFQKSLLFTEITGISPNWQGCLSHGFFMGIWLYGSQVLI